MKPDMQRRYHNDVIFNNLVNRIADSVRHGEYTMQDLRDAIEAAEDINQQVAAVDIIAKQVRWINGR